MSAIPEAIIPNLHTNLLNVYIQIANKMGFQPKKKSVTIVRYLLLDDSLSAGQEYVLL
jgi:hypothetical protein